MKGIKSGLWDSLPIVAGYLPIAFAFGVAAVQAGLTPGLATLISGIVFAGGSQFVLVSLLAAGGTVLTVAPTVLLMNARHLLYGRPIADLLGTGKRSVSPVLLAFGMTDEVFATVVSRIEGIAADDREHWYVGLQLGAYLSWVAGTILGATIGAEVLVRFPALGDGLSFVLPAFFFALLLSMKGRVLCSPTIVGVLATAGLLLCIPAAAAIPLGIAAGAIAGCWSRRGK
ncbi:branched-chain amino acid ABC transporter permease [Verminephrobacter aporrectodeae subsp. tuberculatae]|uniref:AzlC family ABC transporter permease n=1 Tax=Verminephrobacter aporrectodeae TaxID=1110389 RepID=UPI002243EFDC|nr:AzlC family ABC transporter permease [Verminephrobacter aporrectodeae]MCW8200030.1 branched-chain amino acid ABC transporter permease [Verminephrobacter aporrectodeae subsp. tuberculatae]